MTARAPPRRGCTCAPVRTVRRATPRSLPGGATLFTETDIVPDFVDYALGGAVTWNSNRIVGIEGEVGANIGLKQSLSSFAATTVS